MLEKKYTCDGCGQPFQDNAAYMMALMSLDNRPIMGDNRIEKDKHLCGECFNKVCKLFNWTGPFGNPQLVGSTQIIKLITKNMNEPRDWEILKEINREVSVMLVRLGHLRANMPGEAGLCTRKAYSKLREVSHWLDDAQDEENVQ